MQTLRQALKQAERAQVHTDRARVEMEAAMVAIRAAELHEDMTSCGVQVCPRHFHGNFSTYHPSPVG